MYIYIYRGMIKWRWCNLACDGRCVVLSQLSRHRPALQHAQCAMDLLKDSVPHPSKVYEP